MRRFILIILCLSSVLLALAQQASGSCGLNAEWSYANNKLIISGTGPIKAQTNGDSYPWAGYAPNITSVEIEEGITVIPAYCFYKCRFKTITIPSSVTSIASRAFENCSYLVSITIPNTVTSLGSIFYLGCTRLKTVVIGTGVTSIPESMFSECSALTSVEIKGAVKTIKQNTFLNCKSLTSFTIPNSVTSIGNDAFNGCSGLTSITIPKSVTSIGSRAFSNCTSLTSLCCKATTPPTCDNYTFTNVPCANATLFVPNSALSAYQSANYWKNFGSIVPIFTISTSCDKNMGTITGAGEYIQGEQVTLKATPNYSYEFVRWSDGTTDNPYVFNASSDKNITAEFRQPVLVFEDGQAYTNHTTTAVKTLNYTRTFSNTSWQAFYVPFQMSYEDWADEFEVAKVNNFHQSDTDDDGVFDTLEMEIIKVKSGTLKQNHPYLIRAKVAGEKTITLENTTLYPAEENAVTCSSVETLYTFTGTYSGVSGTDMMSNGYYSMGGGLLHQASSSAHSLAPYRWYLKMESRDGQVIPAPSSIRIKVFGDEDDSVEGIATSTHMPLPTQTYDLQGRKLDSAVHGIYILNNKKVMR